jgi:hypothetical protein
VGKSKRALAVQLVGEREDFDPRLGLFTGETWWELGKNFAPAMKVDVAVRRAYLVDWSERLRKQLHADGFPDSEGAVTPEALGDFVDTVLRVLEKKFDGEAIEQDVRHLVRHAKDAIFRDEDRYLRLDEPGDVFWAIEYEWLFTDLQRPRDGRGWLNAVARCEAEDCRRFFIKQRPDNRFHTDSCRTRTANRRAYQERNGQKPHSKRGRPRGTFKGRSQQ